MATQSTDQTLQFVPLSPLDNIMPRAYTRLLLCVQTAKTAAGQSAVTDLLSKGLRKTVEQIPFLDGEVVPDTTSLERQGRYAIRVSQPERLQLQSKDLTKSSNPGSDWKWSFQNLAEENWPSERFDGNILSPVAPFPDPFDSRPAVMAAQANYIEGGLLLCVAFHHHVMDGSGTGIVLRLWAQNCREIEHGESDLVETDIAAAISISRQALDRSLLTPIGMTKKKETTGRIWQHPEYEVDSPATEPPKPVWFGRNTETNIEIFYFSSDALARLKHAAKSDDPAKWISTNDALSALLWSSITRARLRQAVTAGNEEGAPVNGTNGSEPTVVPHESKLGMANNGRRKLDPPLPDSYVGNVNLYSLAVMPTATLVLEEALPDVALSVRASVNDVSDERIRSAVRFIDALPDIGALKPGFTPYLGIDLAITSWAELGLNGLDWGQAVGKVERVRVPAMKFDGLGIVLPRTLDGGLEVLLGLTTETMSDLLRDLSFMSFARLIAH